MRSKRILLKIIAFSLVFTASCATPSTTAVFDDVHPAEWYAADVDHIASLGLITGTSASTFSPSENMTRAMFVTILGRYADINTASTSADGTITESDVNMRSQPNTSSTVLTLLRHGTSEDDLLGLLAQLYDMKNPNDLMLICRAAKNCGAISFARRLLAMTQETIGKVES